MFMLLFLQDSKNQDQYVCYYQVPSFRCITTSTSSTDRGILFALLLVDRRFSLAILSELPHDLPVYMRLFACRDRILRWFRLSTVPIGCACLSPLGPTTLFLGLTGLTSLRWLLFLDVSFYPYFKHFSLLYKISLIMQLCQQFIPYSHHNTHHTTIDGSFLSHPSYLAPLPHTTYCLVQYVIYSIIVVLLCVLS